MLNNNIMMSNPSSQQQGTSISSIQMHLHGFCNWQTGEFLLTTLPWRQDLVPLDLERAVNVYCDDHILLLVTSILAVYPPPPPLGLGMNMPNGNTACNTACNTAHYSSIPIPPISSWRPLNMMKGRKHWLYYYHWFGDVHLFLVILLFMTEHWLKQPKMLPCHIAVECQKLRCINLHSTPANKSSTGVGMSVDQVKFTYPCLPAFIMSEHWLKQPKIQPYHIAVQCQTMKMHWPPQHSCK